MSDNDSSRSMQSLTGDLTDVTKLFSSSRLVSLLKTPLLSFVESDVDDQNCLSKPVLLSDSNCENSSSEQTDNKTSTNSSSSSPVSSLNRRLFSPNLVIRGDLSDDSYSELSKNITAESEILATRKPNRFPKRFASRNAYIPVSSPASVKQSHAMSHMPRQLSGKEIDELMRSPQIFSEEQLRQIERKAYRQPLPEISVKRGRKRYPTFVGMKKPVEPSVIVIADNEDDDDGKDDSAKKKSDPPPDVSTTPPPQNEPESDTDIVSPVSDDQTKRDVSEPLLNRDDETVVSEAKKTISILPKSKSCKVNYNYVPNKVFISYFVNEYINYGICNFLNTFTTPLFNP